MDKVLKAQEARPGHPLGGGARLLAARPPGERRQAVWLFAGLCVAAAFLLVHGAFRGDPVVVQAALAVLLGLFLFGLLDSRLHERTAALQRRLTLVDDIAAAGDARFGPEPMVCRMLQILRENYAADTCIFVLTLPRQAPRLFRIARGAGAAVELAPEERAPLLPLLLAVPPGHGVVYNAAGRAVWQRPGDPRRLREARPLPAAAAERQTSESIAAVLDCPSFVSVPLVREIRVGGRLFIGARHGRFDTLDVVRLHPVLEQITLMLENTCLLEMLVADAAEHERQRIARDLHDTTIQPYIGLKFGLEALARKVRENPPVFQSVQHLIERTGSEIADMRQLISGLSDKGGGGHDSLPASLRRQSARYSELFGIAVEIGAEGELRLSRSLAREILHMVSEGLSNICRHTQARKARIDLRQQAGRFEVRIANDLGAGASPPRSFVPRSLCERSAALGGSVAVDPCDAGACTVITISIPLEE